MTESAKSDFEELAPAWRELEMRSPVRLRAVENERHYRAMVVFMNRLIDKIGDDEKHPLMGLLDVVTFFVRDYEERRVDIPDAKPAGALRFLMRQHGLRQADLAPIAACYSRSPVRGPPTQGSRRRRPIASRRP